MTNKPEELYRNINRYTVAIFLVYISIKTQISPNNGLYKFLVIKEIHVKSTLHSAQNCRASYLTMPKKHILYSMT